MTRDQALIFAVLAGMLVLFLWDRLRYDFVALLALLAAVLIGVIPGEQAFAGFANPVVALIAGALVVSAAIGRSGLVDALIRVIAPYIPTPGVQIAVLGSLVAVLSAFMKNIGALAIFLPVGIQIAERGKRPASDLLMPLGFAALIGGSMTLIGTSPNILASGVRAQLEGAPFEMFDFTPIALGMSVAAVAFLSFGWRLLPKRKAQTPPEALFRIEDYTTEVRIPPGAPIVGRTVGELEALGEGDVSVPAIIREKYRRYAPSRNWTLFADDVLVLESDPKALKKVIDGAGLELVGSKPLADDMTNAEVIGSIEAVVTAASEMVGASPAQLRLRERHGVNLLAVSRRGRRTMARLRRLRFQPGDVLVLQGNLETMRETLAQLGCLPLAPRNVQLGRPRKTLLPVVILLAAIAAAASEAVPAAIAFVAAATAIAIFRVLTPKEIYDSIEWPILVLIGALIPIGHAVQKTGAAALVADFLSHFAETLPGPAVLALVMAASMLATPILHHAAAVLIMGPIAASLAIHLGYRIDPFLLAVAFGANSDFLTPIGHQCNTLVMGPGGYRFGDYWRLGLPLSAIVVAVGIPLILLFWPLK